MNLVKDHIETIGQLCKKHHVEKLYVFGSVLTPSFTDSSDVDFLVEFEDKKIERFVSNFFSLKANLESLLGREVDLVESDAISNPYFKEELEETKLLLYESED
ncbi:nucleotidyltransferase domain-containing protein [Algoriphagus sp. H41]|uniref:Nucleotidyltransferase domain-containing protein n=1 Tax=Algoriphagus oliviformis TaxID=2811231 RepID=A0ABS3C2T7_9BACT|nr:nucleotidyltransferase domain-containing protein [Algoriphagus oliviformis]MBN7811432.1 nucleotidyltransferase domain-containing protein [Algoriphagus oliviformis]